jgi:hypothetical protein
MRAEVYISERPMINWGETTEKAERVGMPLVVLTGQIAERMRGVSVVGKYNPKSIMHSDIINAMATT